jgi:hypothetical protein
LTAGFSSLPTLQAQVQATSVRVAIGFGVDTLGSNHEVFALWRTYLSSGPGCTQESPLWSPTERARKRWA